ncbi:ATPase [Streptomyces olivochromogenes]|uniref:ATPase n=1 Tax=Streptomyces olivochromogenes TaxID=1963 RepID=A0A250VWC2_STROL|nr:ATPase [Streptomyces olivochromogenes]
MCGADVCRCCTASVRDASTLVGFSPWTGRARHSPPMMRKHVAITDMTCRRAPSPADLTFELAAHGASVGEARRRVRAHLGRQGCGDDICETAVLLVSELVTNAVRHTRTPLVKCSVRLEAGKVLVAVEDQGEGGTPIALFQAAADDVHGRGLHLVAALSREWGVRERDGGPGCVVWALVSTAE